MSPKRQAERTAKLTDVFVRDASFDPPTKSPNAKSYFIRDTVLPGFAIRITANDAKTFYAERKLNGKRCLFNCGSYPATTVTQARKAASVALSEIRQGFDPNIKVIENKIITAQKKVMLDNTFGACFKRYMEQHGLTFDDTGNRKELPDKSNTQRDLLGVEKRLSCLTMWKTPFHLLEINLITAAFQQVGKDIFNQHQNQTNVTGVATINKTYRYCVAAWNKEANRTDYIGPNPFIKWKDDIKPERTKSRTRELMLESNAGTDWLKGIAKMRNDPKFHRRVIADYILLTLLWGTRKNEANKLEWRHIQFDTQCVVFRDTKNGKDHWLPFGDYVKDILLQRKTDNEKWIAENSKRQCGWIFPSRIYGKKLSEPRNAMSEVNISAGITISLHDLRRTFVGETMSATKDSLLTKLSVNHSSGNSDITASYFSIRAKLKTLRPYFQEWEKRLLNLAGVIETNLEDDEVMKALLETIKTRPDLVPALKQHLNVA